MVAAAIAPQARTRPQRPGRGAVWTIGRAAMRALAVTAAAFALCWIAMVNGQPFFRPETLDHVRAAASAWAQLTGAGGAAPVRAAIYGLLASPGALGDGFWITAFVQGLALALLAEIVLRAGNVTSLGAYGATMAVLALGTSAPFFAGLVSPAIWAGLAIVAAAALFAFSERLGLWEMAVLSLVLVFAAMALTGGALLLLGLAAAGMLFKLVRGRASADPWLGALVCAAGVCAAAAAALAFGPVGAPVPAAQSPPMAVWSLIAPDVPVDLAGLEARPAAETPAFGARVARQLVDVDLSDFSYAPSLRARFAQSLPTGDLARMQTTSAWHQALPLSTFRLLQSAVAAAALVLAAWFALRPRRSLAPGADAGRSAANLFMLVCLAGALVSVAIGSVAPGDAAAGSAPVLWCLPLAAMLMAYVRSGAWSSSRPLHA